jgi:hypothetical protein
MPVRRIAMKMKLQANGVFISGRVDPGGFETGWEGRDPLP